MIQTEDPERHCNVLFLCPGSSARSILAEAILNRVGAPRFRACSAGSHPKGEVNPYALDLFKRLDYDTSRYRSKAWDEFAKPGAPKMPFVITVCDSAAGKACPVWPGQPDGALGHARSGCKFTASTCFANPAVTLARSLSKTFAGIAPGSVPGFLAAQICGALNAVPVFAWLLGNPA